MRPHVARRALRRLLARREKLRRCWFCKYRKAFVEKKVWWRGHWRKACPTCQVHYRGGDLKEHR